MIYLLIYRLPDAVRKHVRELSEFMALELAKID